MSPRILQPRKSKKQRRAVAIFAKSEREWSPNKWADIYSTMQHYKSTLQPRTAFSYKAPAHDERVASSATLIPRPSKKRLDTSEAPNTEG